MGQESSGKQETGAAAVDRRSSIYKLCVHASRMSFMHTQTGQPATKNPRSRQQNTYEYDPRCKHMMEAGAGDAHERALLFA